MKESKKNRDIYSKNLKKFEKFLKDKHAKKEIVKDDKDTYKLDSK